MARRSTGARVLTWIGLPLLCIVVFTVGATFLGSAIGSEIGSAEGEGFIGFFMGLYAGPPLGLLIGLIWAWRVDAKRR